MLLLLLLSHFSHVRLCVTPQMAAHQAPLSLGLSRQEYWSGVPFPSPMHESESEREVAQSCQTLSNPMDCCLPGSSVHGIFQARVGCHSLPQGIFPTQGSNPSLLHYRQILYYLNHQGSPHIQFISVAQSCPTLRPHESQHARPP